MDERMKDGGKMELEWALKEGSKRGVNRNGKGWGTWKTCFGERGKG